MNVLKCFLSSILIYFSVISYSFLQSQTVKTGTKESTIMAYDNGNEVDFKLVNKIEGSLEDALKVTKEKHKFLILYNDPNNKSAQEDFDVFINDQEEAVLTSFLKHETRYNGFNYYLATKKNNSWLRKNKITDSPCVIILGENGEVLATAKSTLADKAYILSHYDYLIERLKEIYKKEKFTRIITNKKSSDDELIKAFYDVLQYWNTHDYYVPRRIEEADEGKFEFITFDLNKKQVQEIWDKLIEVHQNDVKLNAMLAEVILKEIKGFGFNRVFFGIQKVLNDTDFKSIDYLIKHYGRCVTIRFESTEIFHVLHENKISYYYAGGIKEKSDPKKVKETYKKLIACGKENLDIYKEYFYYLKNDTENGNLDNIYLKEFDVYFDKILATEGDVIQKLDEMHKEELFAKLSFMSEWTIFKWEHSNLCDYSARYVVLHPEAINYIKKAIKWSEYSLDVNKNVSRYLDTLAQLYFKDGQEEKAITTQTLAVKYLNDDVEEETAKEIRETLSKMQNGTY